MRNLMLHTIGSVLGKYCIPFEIANKIFSQGKDCWFMFDDGYQSIYDLLVSAKPEICNRVHIFCVAGKIGGLNDWDTEGELAGKQLLNWDEIFKLQSLGVRFGSHSLTHANLTKLGDKELEMETKESKRILEERLGEPAEGFAYPYGYFNNRVIAAVKYAGYKWAVTTSDSTWEGRGNPYRMRRINISGLDQEWLIYAKLKGLYDLKAVWELPGLCVEKVISMLRGDYERK